MDPIFQQKKKRPQHPNSVPHEKKGKSSAAGQKKKRFRWTEGKVQNKFPRPSLEIPDLMHHQILPAKLKKLITSLNLLLKSNKNSNITHKN